jgi:hypothetical protein
MASALTAQVEDIGRASRRAAVQSLVALGALGCSLGFAAWRLASAERDFRKVQAQVIQLRDDGARLTATKQQLEGDTHRLLGEKQKLELANQGLEAEVQRLRGPLVKLVQLKSSSESLPGVRDPQGRQIYDFAIWLDLPDFRKVEINEVHYHFGHPSALKQDRVGRLPANGFSISYRGWGCFRQISVTFKLKDGSSFQQQFDQCLALGW